MAPSCIICKIIQDQSHKKLRFSWGLLDDFRPLKSKAISGIKSSHSKWNFAWDKSCTKLRFGQGGNFYEISQDNFLEEFKSYCLSKEMDYYAKEVFII